MTSNLPNTDSDTDKPVPDPRPASKRRVAWEHKGNAVADTRSLPELELAPLDLVWSGIVLAAAFYPIVLGGFLLVFLLFAYGFKDLSFDVFVSGFSVFACSVFVGLIYGIIVSIPAFFLTQLLRWSLQGVISDRGMSGIYGGMTGFLCTCGSGLLSAIATGLPSSGNWYEWLPFALMSVLAIVMGHFGAIWTGYRKRHVGFPFFEPIFSFDKQITISYLMKLTFIVAGLTVAFKAAGTAGLYIGIAWLTYLFVQTFLLVCDHWITLWLSRRE